MINHELHFSDLFTIEDEILCLVKGYTGNQNQVLSNFPMDTSFYQPDVREIMISAIEKFGTEL